MVILYLAWSLSMMGGRQLFEPTPNGASHSRQPDASAAPIPSFDPSTEEHRESPETAPVEPLSPQNKLELPSRLPIGTTYDEARAILPQLSDLELNQSESATYATMPADILGYPFVIRIDFREYEVHNITYSYGPVVDKDRITEILEDLASHLESNIGEEYLESTTTDDGARMEYYRLIGGSIIVDATVVSAKNSYRLVLHIRSQ